MLVVSLHLKYNESLLFFPVEEKKKTTLHKVNAAKTKVRSEITDMSNRLKEARETIQKFQQELRVLEGGSAQPAPV